MEINKSDLLKDKTDELIEDREQQKKLVHPYRKYQLFIILSLIISIIFISILYHQNKKLQDYIKQKDISYSTLQDIDNQSKGITQLLDIVNVNYKLINNLDKRKNINIIRKPNEIYFLSSLISDSNEITYDICYKSSIDGQSPQFFYKNCASSSPLVFLIETKYGYRFGVFINTFIGNDFDDEIYLRDENAFIFSFDTLKKYEIKDSDKDYAIFLRKNKFPWFGKKDIFIGDNFGENANSFCEYPNAFKRNEDDKGEYILNGGIKKFIIKEIEILTIYIRAN